MTDLWLNNRFGSDSDFWGLLNLFHAKRGVCEDLDFKVYMCEEMSLGEGIES